MRKEVEFLKREPSNREYTIADICTHRLFPWAKNGRTVKKLILADTFTGNVLRAKVEGEGRRRRYKVKGKNIIKFINLHGPYLMGTVRKQHNEKTKEKGLH